MKVEVELLGVLKSRVGSNSLIVEIPNPPTELKNFLKQLRINHPGMREAVDEDGSLTTSYIAFINGMDYRLLGGVDYVLKDGDRVSLVPISHGG